MTIVVANSKGLCYFWDMKNAIALLVLLAACGRQGPLVFSVSADATAEDVANLDVVVKALNAHVGCTQVATSASSQVFVVDENLPWPTSVIAFATQKANEKDLSTIDAIGAYFTYSQSIVYTSAAQIHEDFKGANWTPDQINNVIVRLGIHELGHSLGLNHTTRPSDIMFPSAGNDPISDDDWKEFVAQLKAVHVVCTEGDTLSLNQ